MRHLAERTMKRKTRKRKPKPPPPVVWTWKDQFLVLGSISGILALVVAAFVLLALHRQRKAIEGRVEQRRIKHDLSESQVRELLDIELKYHGNGNPLSMRPRPTTGQRDAHRREISELVHAKLPDQATETPPK